MRVGGLFDGVGLLAYGLELAWLCEKDEWRRPILARRWPRVPIYDDVRAVDARSACRVDLIAGGFPCKGASTAGLQTGFAHPETALWREMARVIRDVRPRYVLVESVANLLALHDGECFGEVVGTLAALGFDCWWDCVPAAAFGAPHGRDRVFLVAHSPPAPDAERDSGELQRRAGEVGAALEAQRAAEGTGRGVESAAARGDQAPPAGARGVPVQWGDYEAAIGRWEAIIGRRGPEPVLCRVDDGRTRRVERSRLSALGDGVLVQAGWLIGSLIVDHAKDDASRGPLTGWLPRARF